MKITDRSTISPLPAVQAGLERASRAEEKSTGKPDRLSLSDEAQRLLQKDAARTTALAREIAAGRYVVDLDRLAEAIVRRGGSQIGEAL